MNIIQYSKGMEQSFSQKKKQSESKVITFFVKAKQGPGKQRRPRLHHFQSATSRVFMNEEKLKQDLKFRFQFI